MSKITGKNVTIQLELICSCGSTRIIDLSPMHPNCVKNFPEIDAIDYIVMAGWEYRVMTDEWICQTCVQNERTDLGTYELDGILYYLSQNTDNVYVGDMSWSKADAEFYLQYDPRPPAGEALYRSRQ